MTGRSVHVTFSSHGAVTSDMLHGGGRWDTVQWHWMLHKLAESKRLKFTKSLAL